MERNITTIRPFSIPKAVFFRRIVGKLAYKGKVREDIGWMSCFSFALRERGEDGAVLVKAYSSVRMKKSCIPDEKDGQKRMGAFPYLFPCTLLNFCCFTITLYEYYFYM